MNQEKCGCNPCDCASEEKGKAHFHHALKPVWPLMPDHLHDILHSLDVQKLAVLREVKEWSDAHNQAELSKACDMKIAKIEKRIQDEEQDMD